MTAAPSSVVLGDNENNFLRVFPERSDVTLAAAVQVDQFAAASYIGPATTPVTIPAGTVVTSYMLRLDHTRNSGQSIRNATVTFDECILGVIVEAGRLDATDATLGSPTTLYPTGLEPGDPAQRGRGLDIDGVDRWGILADKHTIAINRIAASANDQDQIRVLVGEPGIVATQGAVRVLSPAPASVTLGSQLDDNLQVFAERGCVMLGADLAVDATQPGSYDGPGASPEFVPAGTVVASYFVHFDTVGTLAVNGASITFDRAILGVIVDNLLLDASDGLLGAVGTEYPMPGSNVGRQYETGDLWSITQDGRTIVLDHVAAGAHEDSMRVILASDVAQLDLPPVANAGPDQSIRAQDTVLLDGSGSFDDNTPTGQLTYEWSFSVLPSGSMAVLAGANTATPSFVADLADTYVLELFVTDAAGFTSDPDEVVISSSNLAPTAAAGPDQLVIVGNPVLLDGSGSTDPEYDPLTYAWTLTTAPAGSMAALSDANTASPALTPDVEGIYVVTLEVSDAIGPGTADSVEITATTPAEFAEIQIVACSDIVTQLSPSAVTTKGNQNAYGNFLTQAIRALDKGDTAEATNKLASAIARADGWALRGAADSGGPNLKDWITDAMAQITVYDQLTAALDALNDN